MTSLNDVIWPTLGMVRKNISFQDISLDIFSNFNHDQLVLKTMFEGLKRQLSSHITEKLLNDVSKSHYMSDTGHCMEKEIFSKYSSYHI